MVLCMSRPLVDSQGSIFVVCVNQSANFMYVQELLQFFVVVLMLQYTLVMGSVNPIL